MADPKVQRRKPRVAYKLVDVDLNPNDERFVADQCNHLAAMLYSGQFVIASGSIYAEGEEGSASIQINVNLTPKNPTPH